MEEPKEIDLTSLMDPKTPERVVNAVVSSHCRIDLANLDAALSRHAALFAYAMAAFEMAKVAEARIKWRTEVVKSEEFAKIQLKGKSATAAEKLILTLDSVQTVMDELHASQEVTGRLRALINGLEHRRDMLVQISAKQRQEMAM